MTGERIVVYGAGGLGREVLQLVRDIHYRDSASVLGFIDDGVEAGIIRNHATVLGGLDFFDTISEPISVVFGVASSKAKERLYRQLKRNTLISFPTFVHSAATISDYAKLSEGVVVSAGCHINPDAKIGVCVFLNFDIMVGHDSQIGDFSSVMPKVSVSGNSNIGKRCLIGTMSSIHQGITIGDDCTVGMGSIVLRDIPDGATVFGNPARRIS